MNTSNEKKSTVSSAYRKGYDNQRKADLENGFFLNPILSGDRPDPSVLKVGKDYYLVPSSFESVPGLCIWHSRDLVNWEPVGPAITSYMGSVYAPDLCYYKGRYYIYFPTVGDEGITNRVVWADDIRGPWSDPIDLKIGRIDPGHVVSAEGKRFIFLSDGYLVPLSEDGLSVVGKAMKVYDGWKYPEAWDVESFALEGPKLLRRGEYYYMLSAEGGTAGPATSHMVIMARSKTLEGPWENSPYNPVVRTSSRNEKWWSKGHGTLVVGPDDKQWYLLYHGYENGFYTLGRQTLLEPVDWTEDGWVIPSGFKTDDLIPMPIGGERVIHGMPVSDDFSGDKLSHQWCFYKPLAPVDQLYRIEDDKLFLKGIGTAPVEGNLLTQISGDQHYEIEIELELDATVSAGLMLFYNQRLYAGIGFSNRGMIESSRGESSWIPKPAYLHRNIHIRLRNHEHVLTFWFSSDGRLWKKHGNQFEVSGYHHNTAGGFLSLRPALFAFGSGEACFKYFKYKVVS